MVSAALRQAFIQPDRASASQALRHVADQLRAKWPRRLAAHQRVRSCWRTAVTSNAAASGRDARRAPREIAAWRRNTFIGNRRG